jgi:hypothetical protein
MTRTSTRILNVGRHNRRSHCCRHWNSIAKGWRLQLYLIPSLMLQRSFVYSSLQQDHFQIQFQMQQELELQQRVGSRYFHL